MRNNKIYAVIVAIALLLACCYAVGDFYHRGLTAAPTMTVERAKALAIKEYLGTSPIKIAKFSCRLIEETEAEFVFTFENLDRPQRPGADVILIINKMDGAIKHVPGM